MAVYFGWKLQNINIIEDMVFKLPIITQKHMENSQQVEYNCLKLN